MTFGISTRMRPPRSALELLLVLCCASSVKAFIDTDGVCSVFTFLPFTITTETGSFNAGSLGGDNRTNYGFSHMAAALLAADHFNSRNSSVIPELAELNGCNVQLDVTSFFDTGSLTRLASQRLFDQEKTPCALAGPFNDYPAAELSVMAQAARFPMVIHRAFNPRLVSNFLSSFTSQVYPDILSSTRTLVSFLLDKGRDNYVALLYSLGDINFARREALVFQLDAKNVKWMTSSYISPFLEAGEFLNDVRKPFAALKHIKESGYRTIVVAMDTPWLEVQRIADAAEELEMNTGDHFWVWFDVFEPSLFYLNTNVTKLVAGSAWILPLEVPSDGQSNVEWAKQGKAEVDRLNRLNPIPAGQPGYKFAADDFFQEVDPEYGSGFMYDTIMCIGFGACLTERSPNGTVSGKEHVRGIRRASFSGTTGHVLFGDELFGDPDALGIRSPSTVFWGAFNFLPPETGEFFRLSDIVSKDVADRWVQQEPFIYRDGRTVPPDLLRDEPEQNYLSEGLRAMGLAFMAFVMFAAVLSASWVFRCRKHRVVKASQPIFLYLICFGALVQASAVLTLSFDESYNKSDSQLSRACMATPWLLSLGHIVIYASLFTKMWRVHQVLQFTRRLTNLKQLVIPMVALVLCDLVLLSLWTALDPIVWERTVINDVTGESIGECVSDHAVAFWSILVVFLIIPMIATEYFAWKTKDVDEAYTESKWVFIMIVWQAEVMLIGVPIAVLLRDVSTDGRYLGYAFIFLTFPFSTIGFIILPKYIAYRRDVRGVEDRPKRGERVHGRVTGVNGGVSGISNPSQEGTNGTTITGDRTGSSSVAYSEDVSRDSANELPQSLVAAEDNIRELSPIVEKASREGSLGEKLTNGSAVDGSKEQK